MYVYIYIYVNDSLFLHTCKIVKNDLLLQTPKNVQFVVVSCIAPKLDIADFFSPLIYFT